MGASPVAALHGAAASDASPRRDGDIAADHPAGVIPFGVGWDLFGTADYKLDIGIIGARFGWFMSVGATVAGYIVAVYIAHIIALRIVRDSSALRSQYPMLLLVVSYTATDLWMIAQPVVN